MTRILVAYGAGVISPRGVQRLRDLRKEILSAARSPRCSYDFIPRGYKDEKRHTESCGIPAEGLDSSAISDLKLAAPL